jgi:hypothetical protein
MVLSIEKCKGEIMTKNPYPDEKFSSAVYSMATSATSIQERIHNAYLYNIMYVKPEGVPESARYKFKSLLEELPNALSMSTEKAVEKASIILDIADSIKSYYLGL